MSRRSALRMRGQAAIEAVVVVPLCVTFALVLVDAGLYGADQVAIERAATAAGAAVLAGDDADAAARAAAPAGLRRHLRVSRRGSSLTVSTPARGLVLSRIAPVRVHATAVVEGAAR
jgi:hypothetical protein